MKNILYSETNIMEELLDELNLDGKNNLHGDECKCPECREYDSEIIGKDDRKLINSTSQSPFRYICQIEINRGGILERGRTGTLIGPRTILTAAHCIWDESKNKKEDLKKVKIRIIPGRRGSYEPLPVSTAVNLVVPAGYSKSKGGTALDFGIIHTKETIGNDIGYWSFNYKKWVKDPRGVSILKGALPYLPSSGKLKLNIAGYPVDKPGKTHLHRGKFIYWDYDRAVNLIKGMLYYLNDTFKGHSGSPVWIKRSKWKGGRVLVGIHVAGTKTQNRAVFISKRVRDFILDNLK